MVNLFQGKTILRKQGTDKYAYAPDIIKELGISSMLFKLAVVKLVEKGFARWYSGNSHVTATDKGLMYAFENKLVS
jgi:hypothetical protein